MSDDQSCRREPAIFRYFKNLMWVALFVAGGMAAYHYLVVKPMGSPFEKLANALGEVTRRKVNIEGHTLTLESAETRELVVIKRRTQSILKYESRWLGSEKIVIV